MANTIIGIGDLAVDKAGNTLTTLGLGSCVGLIFIDRFAKVGGMAHIMLPQAPAVVEMKHKAKYGNLAFEELLKMMRQAGANPARMVAKMAGGAHMFSSAMDNDVMKVGQRNIEIVHRLLKENHIMLTAEDVGGTVGRTITLDCQSGDLLVRTAYPKTQKII